jgi:hypothetical protein
VSSVSGCGEWTEPARADWTKSTAAERAGLARPKPRDPAGPELSGLRLPRAQQSREEPTLATLHPVYRRYGLYYPYIQVRNERWLKIAALYWPKIVRLVPDSYRMHESYTVEALSDDFLMRRPPGPSVEAIGPRFLDLLANHADELRNHFDTAQKEATELAARMCPAVWEGPGPRPEPQYMWELWDARRGMWRTGVHVSEMTREVRDALVDAQLALAGGGTSTVNDQRDPTCPPKDWDLNDWVVMHPDLVAVYTSVLAEDFALANRLQPTTDQEDAYSVTNNWTTDRIAAVLLDGASQGGSPAGEEPAEALGFLALDLVVPADLDAVPVGRIIEIRERYRSEFFAFGQAVDQAADSIAELSTIQDEIVLKEYLNDVIAVRFAQPLEDLRKEMKRLTGDAAMTSINVKTELPAAAALAGGALLTGQPFLAGTSAVAIGLMAIRRSARQHRKAALQSAPAASFLLHTQAHLQPRKLLQRVLDRLAKIAGIRELLIAAPTFTHI